MQGKLHPIYACDAGVFLRSESVLKDIQAEIEEIYGVEPTLYLRIPIRRNHSCYFQYFHQDARSAAIEI